MSWILIALMAVMVLALLNYLFKICSIRRYGQGYMDGLERGGEIALESLADVLGISQEGKDQQGMNTYWKTEDGKYELNLKELLLYMDNAHIPVKEVPVKAISHLIIDQDYRKKSGKRVMNASLDYPLIVSIKDGKYKAIIDGNHRAYKAVVVELDKIKIRELDLDSDNTPEIYKKLFGNTEYEQFKL